VAPVLRYFGFGAGFGSGGFGSGGFGGIGLSGVGMKSSLQLRRPQLGAGTVYHSPSG
jgi:hypothetical protein